MFTLLSVIIGPIITGIIGNALVQRWQLASWFAQQRQLNRKEELDQLQRLFEEIGEHANARLFTLRAFLRSLSSEEASLDERKKHYAIEVARWNEKLNTFYARLTLYLSYGLTIRLENDIHLNFVKASAQTEALYHKKLKGLELPVKSVQKVDGIINTLQGQISDFIRDILRTTIERRKDFIEGSQIFYSDSDINKFSTFQLVKLLFTSDIDRPYVIRST